jgi:peptidoglycan/LPS O-acetylase OafA/YrhL
VNAVVSPRRPAEQRRPVRPLLAESATLAVFATLHLSGALRIGAGTSYGAGIAEALICLALLAGAVALSRWPVTGRRVALAALGFAIFGFFVGLSFTVGSGDTIDLAYHVVMLPVLMATAALVALSGRPAGPVHNSQKLT